MRGKIVLAGLVLSLFSVAAFAQDQTAVPIRNDLYCSGTVSTEAVPRDTYIITGEGSNYKVTFQEGDYVFINRGASQGVKVGDEFSVIRRTEDAIKSEWTKWQFLILRKMGTLWEDEGRVRVVVVHPDTSVGQVEKSCNYVQRGDILLPFAERPAPPLKSENNFDRFAPPSGKATAMIITGKSYISELGSNDIFYVNLGSAQGVKVGDYFRIFRYTGTEHERAYQTRRFAFDSDSWAGVYGFGSAPAKYKWDNTPREVIGEGIVVRTAPNSSSVLLTFGLREAYAGDYVEIE
jgi:Flagellar assembly protein T, C-terminal domain